MADNIEMIKGSEIRKAAPIEPLLITHQPLSSASHLSADKLGMKRYRNEAEIGFHS
jgi:hypothetical protein